MCVCVFVCGSTDLLHFAKCMHVRYSYAFFLSRSFALSFTQYLSLSFAHSLIFFCTPSPFFPPFFFSVCCKSPLSVTALIKYVETFIAVLTRLRGWAREMRAIFYTCGSFNKRELRELRNCASFALQLKPLSSMITRLTRLLADTLSLRARGYLAV